MENEKVGFLFLTWPSCGYDTKVGNNQGHRTSFVSKNCEINEEGCACVSLSPTRREPPRGHYRSPPLPWLLLFSLLMRWPSDNVHHNHQRRSLPNMSKKNINTQGTLEKETYLRHARRLTPFRNYFRLNIDLLHVFSFLLPSHCMLLYLLS